MKKTTALASKKQIENAILLLRGDRVLLDTQLAALYGVSTKALNQAVKRNRVRFPADFMFRLTVREAREIGLRSQSVTTKAEKRGGRRSPPYAFTEQGIAMLSSVLRSRRAVNVNIEIMRAFVRLRRMLAFNAELAGRLDEIEARLGAHDEQFVEVIQAIRELMEPPPDPPRPRIGFHV